MSSSKSSKLLLGWRCTCGRIRTLPGTERETIAEREEIADSWQQRGKVVMAVCAPHGCGNGKSLTAADLIPVELQN